MKLLLVGVVVLLAGCAGREPEVRTVRVEVPVRVPCKTQEVAAGLKKSDDLELKVRALLAERRQRIAYERELVVAAGACE